MALLLCAFQLVRWGLESLAFWALPRTSLTDELVRAAVYAVLFGALLALVRRRGVDLHLLPRRPEQRAAENAGHPADGEAHGVGEEGRLGAGRSSAAGVEAVARVTAPARCGRSSASAPSEDCLSTGPNRPSARADGWGLSGGYVVALAAFAVLLVATPFATGQAGELAVWAALACGCVATPLFEEALFRGYVWDRLARVFGAGWKCLVVSAVLFGLWHVGYVDVVAWQIAQPEALSSAPLWVHLGAKVVFATGIGLLLGLLRLRQGTCLAPAIFHAFWNLLA